ncbi:MAG: ferredoxin [Myxococcota bacterium]
MALLVQVDREACQGSLSCVRRAPRTFSLDAEGKSVVAKDPRDDEAAIRAAAAACPFFAIRVREGERGA